jgi:hypothetical protein
MIGNGPPRNTSRLILAFFFAGALFSCRFRKPLFSVPEHHYVNVDSVTHNTEKTDYFRYLNFKHGLSLGNGGVVRVYDPAGHLAKKTVFRSTRGGMKDGDNRHYMKECIYDSLGHISEVHCTIRQNFGRAGTTVYEKRVNKIRR